MTPAMSEAEKASEIIAAIRWTVALAALVALMIAVQAPGARLVGHECEGASGPLYGAEESDFPRCGDIRPR